MKAKDVRKGKVIIYKGAPHRVLDFAHRTPWNLRSFVQVRLRNVLNGNQVDDRFRSFDELDEADMSTMKANFLYSDDTGFHFMNMENYEQVALNEDLVGESKFYLIEGSSVE